MNRLFFNELIENKKVMGGIHTILMKLNFFM